MLFDLKRMKYIQLDFRIETDNTCCFILLLGLQKKQFLIPKAYRLQVELQIKELLKIGVVKPTNSSFNSPIFGVPK
jgi:hypothetical protein